MCNACLVLDLRRLALDGRFHTRVSDIANMLRRLKLLWTARTLLLAAAAAVPLAPLAAQDFGAAAKVVTLSGRVSVERDGNEWALTVGSPVQPKQIVITGPDGYAQFQLSDGSTFEVFKNSKAVFRSTPGDLLDVFIGWVKVQIQHRNGPNPNRVTTQTAVISVRGTVFDVVAEDEDTTFVSVDEGVVNVRHTRFGGSERDLHAGEWVRVFKDQPLARLMDKGNAARVALRAAAQAVYDGLARRPGGGSSPAGGGTSGAGTAQGDKGKGTGDSGSGTGNAPPPPPPPAPPGP
jgi:ferric-dicitrate binding protein FerR (iron transport regulator)